MEYLFYNGIIITMDGEEKPSAVLVKDSIIKCVGTVSKCNHQASSLVKSIDLKGNVLLPGFIDTHTHFFEYAKTFIAVNLNPAESVQDVRNILIDYSANMPRGIEWVGGSGWNKNIYPDLTGFNKHLLDEIFPDIPVSLESKDFHSKICNSLALERAGITKDTPDPKGGMIGRFEDGEPDGFTYEKAWELIDRVVPAYPPKVAKAAMKKAIKQCYKYGLTGVHVMESEDKYKFYKELLTSNEINFNFCWHFPSDMLEEMISKGVKSYTGDEQLKIGGMKIFMDGSLGSQTAWMYEPYAGTNNTGMSILTEEELYSLVKRGAENGISSTIHGIGDRCNNLILRVIDRVNKDTGTMLPQRIEHLQCVRPDDIQLLKDNQVYCAVQPIHIKADVKNIQKYWPHCEKNVYPFKTLLDNGITLGFGSDAPVETLNPFEGIYSALERKYGDDPSEESWMPSEKIDLMDALESYTIKAAKGSLSDNVKGSITEGKYADLIVIKPLPGLIDVATNYEEWLSAETLVTMVGGKIVRTVLRR